MFCAREASSTSQGPRPVAEAPAEAVSTRHICIFWMYKPAWKDRIYIEIYIYMYISVELSHYQQENDLNERLGIFQDGKKMATGPNSSGNCQSHNVNGGLLWLAM